MTDRPAAIHPMTLALDWARRGIPAFPCILLPGADGHVDKVPVKGSHGHYDATVDLDKLRDMFVRAEEQHRGPGVLAAGLCPGAGGCVVLDPDVKEGQGGPDYADSLGIPLGWLVITASGGQHRWFRKPDLTACYSNRTLPEWRGLIDIRADRGWVVAPGTVTQLGSWLPVAPWPPGGPPVAPGVVLSALTVASGTLGGAESSRHLGALSDAARSQVHPHTLRVLDWMTEKHGAHRPWLHQREDNDEHFVSVLRPGKHSGPQSANIGHAGPGSVHLWSTSWAVPGVDASTTAYPLGRDPAPLGATPPPAAPAAPARGRQAPAAYFLGRRFQPMDFAMDLVAEVPLGITPHGDFWEFQAGVWRPQTPARLGQLVSEWLANRTSTATLATVRLVLSAVALPIDPTEPNPRWINFQNGMLDWRTGELVAHSPDHMSFNQLAVPYDPDAQCPDIDAWLRQVLPPDLLPTFFHQLVGYLMLSGNPFHKAVLLLGRGRNGKGTLLRMLTRLLGADNVSSVTLHDLGDNRFRAADLYGSLANIAGDLDGGWLESTAMFKMVTGGDMVSAERKYGHAFKFNPYAVPVFSANRVFGTPDTSAGYMSRWLVVPFPNSFAGVEMRGLDERLADPAQLAGLAAAGVRALPGLMAAGNFPVPASIAAAMEQFERESDPVRAFLADATGPDAAGWITRQEMWNAYQFWANDGGTSRTLTRNVLFSRLEEAGLRAVKMAGVRGFKGRQLLSAAPGLIPVEAPPAGANVVEIAAWAQKLME